MTAPARLPTGEHWLLDLAGIAAGPLADPAGLEALLRAAAIAAGATAIGANFHHFGEGGGVTGVLLLRESHISIHSWPEHGFAALDIYMCGNCRPERAVDALLEALQPARPHCRRLLRGGPDPANENNR